MLQKYDDLILRLKDISKMGDIKKIAKEIKKDHDLALKLWASGDYHPRLLAILIMDKKVIDQELIDILAIDMAKHTEKESNQMTDWLLANQLMKDNKLKDLLLTWSKHDSPVLRRLYWYYQARLRWMGKIQEDSSELLDILEVDMAKEAPQVQWAMNFTTGWIGVYEPDLRDRCISLGEKLGLYKDEVVSKGCTPSYLPEFIKMEVDKRK